MRTNTSLDYRVVQGPSDPIGLYGHKKYISSPLSSLLGTGELEPQSKPSDPSVVDGSRGSKSFDKLRGPKSLVVPIQVHWVVGHHVLSSNTSEAVLPSLVKFRV